MHFKTRYDMIHNGISTFRSGDFRLWTGLPEGDRLNPVVAAVLTVDAGFNNLTSAIDHIAAKNNVTISLAGRNFRAHSTLALKKGVNLLDGVGDFSQPAAGLAGKVWSFEHLAVTPNMIIGSETAPASVAPVRAELKGAMATYGIYLSEKDEIDIVHATLARVMKWESVNDLQQYADDLLELRVKLAEQPLAITVESIYWGTVEGLLQENISI